MLIEPVPPSNFMKKFVLIFLLPFLLAATPIEDNSSINFKKDNLEEVTTLAKNENKPYFVDFYAQWCRACFEMDHKTFRDKKLTSYVNSNYLASKLHAQSFDGISLSQKYEIKAYPAILIFDARGNLKEKLIGYQTADRLLQRLKAADSK